MIKLSIRGNNSFSSKIEFNDEKIRNSMIKINVFQEKE